MKKINISVIVPTWNGQRTILRCLKSLKNQSLNPSEIIVVDNGSTDNTKELVAKTFPDIKLVRLPTNTGVVGGRNAGIEKTQTNSDYILFFDHDMEAKKTMLSELVKTATRFNAGITTPKIYYKDYQNIIWSAGTGIDLTTGQVLFRNGPDLGQFDHDERVEVAPAALLVSKKVIESIHNFDPLYVSSWEDTDFCFRAKKAGFLTYYSAKAQAAHDLAIDSKADAIRLLDRYGFFIGQNRIVFMKRFGTNFLMFAAFFLPIYIAYYFFLAARFGKFNGYLNFLKGTLVGFTKK